MSEVKFSSKDAKEWLEKETHSLFVPIHSKAQKLLDEMRRSLETLSDVSKMLLENSEKEIEKRNTKTYRRARALNKLAHIFIDRTKSTKIPEKVTYDTFHDFVQESQKAFLVTDIDVRNYFPRVSPFFILDRRKFQLVFEKSKDTLKELDSFLVKEYAKTKTLEETFQLLERLQALENQLSNLNEQRTRTENEMSKINNEIAETQKAITELKNRGSLGQLSQLSMEIEVLSAEVKHTLQHLQKPFIKLQSLALRGEGSGLTPEEVSKLNQYVENPFEALATEDANYQLLKQILQKTRRLISEDRLKLKPEKARKAEQVIGNILGKDSLLDLHQKSMTLIARRNQLSTSTEVTETGRNLSKLEERLEGLERRKRIAEGEGSALERTCRGAADRVKGYKTEMEKNILGFMGQKIHLE